MTLRPYQETFVAGIAQKIADGIRTVLGQQATGAGKTVIFSAISHRYSSRTNKSVLILVHRKELLQQTRRTLYKAFGVVAQPIVAGMRYIPDAKVYVGMVESAYRRIDQLQNVGLIIIDEAHIANFSKIHEAFPNTLIIGVTATPLSANKARPLKMYYQDIVCGPQIHELIRMGNLCQNLTIAPKDTVDRASLTVKRGDFDDGLMAMTFSQKRHINNTVEAYQKYAASTKAIVFNVTVEHSQLVAQAFSEAGIPCRHFDGDTESAERQGVLKWYAETSGAVLCNVGIATTGFDEPSIETVIVNKATMSMPLWLQMCGRGSRPHDAKAMFRIIDMGGNAITHGDWNQPRNWEEMFHNPPKASKGNGVAPIKICPQCDSIISNNCRACPQCGYEYPKKEQEMEEVMGAFVVVTKDIDAVALIEQHKMKKEYYPFFEIGRMLAEQAKNTVPQMTDDNAVFILEKYDVLAKQWCQAVGKKYNQWHKDRAKETLYQHLAEAFKGWTNPIQNIVPNTYNVKPFDRLTSLTQLKNLSTHAQ
jgi:superfamily II DNA or RNA helicase